MPDRPAGVGVVAQDSGRCPAKAQPRRHLRLVRSLNDHFPSPASGVVRAQYTSRAFAGACRQAGVRQSMSAIGSSTDNALAESSNATCKRETLQGRKHWSSERQDRLDAYRWLHRYHALRRHSRLGCRSPITYETASETTSTTLAPAV
ncbi:integrase core domain-containing protein [Streptomyces albidoflavus]|uniref:integrase core domain-containing protein n=1 Tax=Streptomyces albidoflavus TaxID=1886 RepID=UPI0033335B8C